jgi:hypothetical protein
VVEAESGAQATFGKHEWIEQEPIAHPALGAYERAIYHGG